MSRNASPVRVARGFAATLAVLLAFAATTTASAAPAAASQPAGTTRILLVGNSYFYVNDLPALVNGIGATSRVHADLIAAPGGSIAERWADGVAAAELASGRWQVLVLQERGGTLACLARPATREARDCTASVAAHRKFADLARKHGVRVIVFGTWGPDSIWQGQLSRGLRRLADTLDAEALDAGPPVRDFAARTTKARMYLDEVRHPSMDASLLMAGLIVRQVTGTTPTASGLEVAPLPVRSPIVATSLRSRQPTVGAGVATVAISEERVRVLLAALPPEQHAGD